MGPQKPIWEIITKQEEEREGGERERRGERKKKGEYNKGAHDSIVL